VTESELTLIKLRDLLADIGDGAHKVFDLAESMSESVQYDIDAGDFLDCVDDAKRIATRLLAVSEGIESLYRMLESLIDE
jgi:hypothetical protein